MVYYSSFYACHRRIVDVIFMLRLRILFALVLTATPLYVACKVWLRESRTRILAYITIIAFSSGEWLISGAQYEANFYCLGTENDVKMIYYSLCCWLLTIYLEAEGSIIWAVFSDACMLLCTQDSSFFSTPNIASFTLSSLRVRREM